MRNEWWIDVYLRYLFLTSESNVNHRGSIDTVHLLLKNAVQYGETGTGSRKSAVQYEKLEEVVGKVLFSTEKLEQVVVMCCSVIDLSPSLNFKASNHSYNLSVGIGGNNSWYERIKRSWTLNKRWYKILLTLIEKYKNVRWQNG